MPKEQTIVKLAGYIAHDQLAKLTTHLKFVSSQMKADSSSSKEMEKMCISRLTRADIP